MTNYACHQLNDLNLLDDIKTVLKSAPAARNRYLFLKDSGIVKIPYSMSELVSAPAPIKQFLLAVLKEPFIGRSMKKFEDESIVSFFQRRFGPKSPLLDTGVSESSTDKQTSTSELQSGTRMLASALTHGIYAGSIDNLSMRSCFGSFWHAERAYGSVVLGQIMRGERAKITYEQRVIDEILESEIVEQSMLSNLGSVVEKMKDASMYTLPKGLGQIIDSLYSDLLKRPNVTLIRNTEVHDIRRSGSKIALRLSFSEIADTLQKPFFKKRLHSPDSTGNYGNRDELSVEADHVVSTLAPTEMLKIATGGDSSMQMSATDHFPVELFSSTSVDVSLACLWYNKEGIHRPLNGFGVLLPEMSETENPECALGIIFDSDVFPADARYREFAGGTLLTVMMGGRYWKNSSQVFSEEQTKGMAISAVKRILNVQDDPDFIKVKIARQCIPQYTVGHDARMRDLHNHLLSDKWQSRLSLTGSGYTGVSLPDCVLASRLLALRIARKHSATGLERFRSVSVE